MRSINDPRQTGKLDSLQELGGRAFTAPDKVHCRAIVERFNFVVLLHHARGSYKEAT
jgi:hypothetical protein